MNGNFYLGNLLQKMLRNRGEGFFELMRVKYKKRKAPFPGLLEQKTRLELATLTLAR